MAPEPTCDRPSALGGMALKEVMFIKYVKYVKCVKYVKQVKYVKYVKYIKYIKFNKHEIGFLHSAAHVLDTETEQSMFI